MVKTDHAYFVTHITIMSIRSELYSNIKESDILQMEVIQNKDGGGMADIYVMVEYIVGFK